MTVVSGVMKVLLPAQSDWKLFHAGESFNVSANNSFEVKSGGGYGLPVYLRVI